MVAQHGRLASLTRRFFARYGFELKSALPVSKSTGHETCSWTTSAKSSSAADAAAATPYFNKSRRLMDSFMDVREIVVPC